MGRTLHLGQVATATIEMSADGQTLNWQAPDNLPDPIEILFQGSDGKKQLFARARSGPQALGWIKPGDHYNFLMIAAGNMIATLLLDTTVSPYRSTVAVTQSSAPPSSSGGAGGGAGGGAASTSASPSWLEQETDVFGTKISNMYLAVGAGIFLMRKKQR